MTDILTENDFSSEKKNAICSKIAFGFSILTFVLYLIFVASVTAIFRVKENNAAVTRLIIILLLSSMTLGPIFSIVSLVKKERVRYIKTIAAVVNIGMIIVIIGTITFTLMIDLKIWLGQDSR